MDILLIQKEGQLMISVRDLTVKYGDAVIIENITFDVPTGSWTMIVGPNGAGKSTIVKAMAQSIPYTGAVLIDGEDASKMNSRALARKVGVLSQGHYVGYGFTAEEVIRLGGYSRRGRSFFKKQNEENESFEDLFEQAVEKTGMAPYLKQSVLKLSGGELQRTFLAQLFAQDPEILILDEPTNHLDIIYQKQIMEMVDNWRKERGRTVVSVVHDLSLAKMFGTDVLVTSHGSLVKTGPVSEVLTSDILDPVYGMDVAAWIRSMAGMWEN
ncbi:MAG: ABC transporter ATP-binding protein [Lachnospiraceae bacterium]|nr:ABC transporter ATP-binding protein [Lachnospiraceae bacterium]